jgi:5-hydroxyisourate hydrolase
MSAITTHILDVSIGKPAAGVAVRLDRQMEGGTWEPIGSAKTDDDGRARDLMPEGMAIIEGVHRLTFDVGQYFSAKQVVGFYTEVVLAFVVNDASEHYHVPLLLSPFGYSTYRGS